jgi:CelD/BcsL family acetyltransferase involved in cellulose biosynthesis
MTAPAPNVVAEVAESASVVAAARPAAGNLQPQSLKFTLGDYCFWQFEFKAIVSDAPLADFLERPADVAAEANAAGDDCIRVIRSFPAETPLPRLTFAERALRYVPIAYPRYYVEFAGAFKDYLAKFSAKSRSTWQRKVRKFATRSGGALDWRQYRTPAELLEFYGLATELSRKTYQEKMFRESFASTAGSREKVLALAERKAVRGYVLFLEGRPVAYVYCDCIGATIVYSLLGYDQDVRDLSPGDVLLFLIIESLLSQDLQEHRRGDPACRDEQNL